MAFSDTEYKNDVGNIPREIAEYYMKNGYMERMIPLNADTCNEIARILDEEGD